MTITDVPPSRINDANAWTRLSWYQTLGLHLGPAAVAFAVALMVAPVLGWLGAPEDFSLSVSFALVLTPVEFGLLLIAAHRATGSWSLRSVRTVLAFRRPLGRWWLLVPVLFAVALGLAVVWTPVGDWLGNGLTGVYPHWALPSYDDTRGFAKPVLIATLLLTLVIDGVVNPIVEEMYFRGYLLPRLPVAGWRAVPVSAALFAIQHYWQPYNWPLIFVLELILTALVVRLRSLKVGMVMHTLANCFGVIIVLVAVIS